MSEQQIAPWVGAVQKAHPKFMQLNIHSAVNWETEANFVKQIVMRGGPDAGRNYLLKVANENPQSMLYAVTNIAAIGLTLNPAEHLAYLVPRDGAIMLDVSYRGLIKLATDCGSIEWARAELVYDSDHFEYLGPAQAPIHRADPFQSDRGEFRGVYCIAKTAKGDVLTEVMSAEQIYMVRDTSMAYARKKQGPWVDWFDQMAKKTVIKRASKTWPRTATIQRLDTAISIVNEHEGLIEETPIQRACREHADSIEYIKTAIAEDNIPKAAEAWHELSKKEQDDLWVAHSKGGPFTGPERKLIKEEFNQYLPARLAHQGEAA